MGKITSHTAAFSQASEPPNIQKDLNHLINTCDSSGQFDHCKATANFCLAELSNYLTKQVTNTWSLPVQKAFSSMLQGCDTFMKSAEKNWHAEGAPYGRILETVTDFSRYLMTGKSDNLEWPQVTPNANEILSGKSIVMKVISGALLNVVEPVPSTLDPEDVSVQQVETALDSFNEMIFVANNKKLDYVKKNSQALGALFAGGLPHY